MSARAKKLVGFVQDGELTLTDTYRWLTLGLVDHSQTLKLYS
jgi:hypothetical protein